jgi:hypothetical protein
MYSEVTASELLTKQVMRKNVLYTENMYIFELILNLVTTGLVLVISGSEFCMPVSKKSAACGLCHILTPSVNFLLLMKHCYSKQLFGQVNR